MGEMVDRLVKYREWIDDYAAKHKVVLGQCAHATAEMVKAFPELQRVAGHVEVVFWGRRGHWWCETAEGVIVDPTASQFPCAPVADDYEPFVPGTEVRVGRCMECGAEIYARLQSLGPDAKPEYPPGASGSCCSEECNRALVTAFG